MSILKTDSWTGDNTLESAPDPTSFEPMFAHDDPDPAITAFGFCAAERGAARAGQGGDGDKGKGESGAIRKPGRPLRFGIQETGQAVLERVGGGGERRGWSDN